MSTASQGQSHPAAAAEPVGVAAQAAPAPAAQAEPEPGVTCVQAKLQAFVLNQHIFENERYRIAPLSLPDHSAFLDGPFSNPDAVPHIDLHAAYPWQQNTRISDITVAPSGSGETPQELDEKRLRKDRLGVYLHWCLPQCFRQGKARDNKDNDGGNAAVEYAAAPDRWIVFRFITTASPVDATSESPAPALTAFIIESNRIRQLGDLDKDIWGRPLDMETETAPFIDSRFSVEEQANVFLGIKLRFDDTWHGEDPDPNIHYHTPLTLLGSANPLFADFQHHNANVFSIHDDLSWADKDGKITTAATAKVSYAVFGYFSHPDHHEKIVCHGSLLDVVWNKDQAPKIEALDRVGEFRKNQPIALGRDSLDAVEAYLRSQPGNFDWPGLLSGMKYVIGQTGRGGTLDAHVAQELRAGFKPIDGGKRWRFQDANKQQASQDKGSKPQRPTDADLEMLSNLDRLQAFQDALDRQERYLRHVLFCEWWKNRAQRPGGISSDPRCQEERANRLSTAFRGLQRISELRKAHEIKATDTRDPRLQATARAQFFSHINPTVVVGGTGSAWPSDFDKPSKVRNLEKLPLQTSCGKTWVKDWLEKIVKEQNKFTDQGMDVFFRNTTASDIKDDMLTKNPSLGQLPVFFKELQNMHPLRWKVPGWVQDTVEALCQEWAFSMDSDNKFSCSDHSPQYVDIAWGDSQPWGPLFVEWEIEYYHVPRRFWSLQRAPDGTAVYRLIPGANLSSYDNWERHRRVVRGRTLLRPNAGSSIVTLLGQIFDKVEPGKLGKLTEGEDWRDSRKNALREALNGMDLLAGSLGTLSDHFLTLNQGTHIMPYDKDTNAGPGEGNKRVASPSRAEEASITSSGVLDLLLPSAEGFDVTPYGESTYSDPQAGRDFKPVTHGQGRFTKFQLVDRFGQVISPTATEGEGLYPCLGPTLACGQNVAEGDGFADSVDLDRKDSSQYFQLGHRINQDARLNTSFVVNPDDVKTNSVSTRWFKDSPQTLGEDDGGPKRIWRAVTEYENPVWGWLVVDYRDRGIQVYDPNGELRGEALLPGTVNGKVYWQVYYFVENKPVAQNSQLHRLLDKLSDSKFLFGLWSSLSEASQHIVHTPSAYDSQLLNLVGRPMALVNIGISLELATAPMQTQSYHDLLKPEESQLGDYSFEVLIGDKSNLHDGLVGYFHLPSRSAEESATTPLWELKGAMDCLYTEFGYPERRPVDAEAKHNAFAKPSTRPIFVKPCFIDPSDERFDDPVKYFEAWASEAATTVVGAIIDPFQPVHFASGILPLSTLTLPPWIVDDALKKMRMLFRGGPLMLQGDLPRGAAGEEFKPLSETTLEVGIPPVTDDGNWSWLQPVAEPSYQTRFAPYNLKSVAADYPLMDGPHTCLEGFYKFGLRLTEEAAANLLTDRPVEDEHPSMLEAAGPGRQKLVKLRGPGITEPKTLKFPEG
ncbi:hypothetical protein F5Y05DRAFT_284150 [Hypoxylon sp. FL0543]|nr:hypothetical protein F5Y05DRAFT_284150 [Hypoxylon sp. FL0543]